MKRWSCHSHAGDHEAEPAVAPLRKRLQTGDVEVISEDAARTLAEAVRARGISLLEAAQQAFVADRRGETRVSFKHDARYALAHEFDRDAWTPGALYMSATDDRFLIMQVAAVDAAETSPLTVQRVKNKLFQDWLAQQRRAARIEWFWGDAQRTAKAMAMN
jgi:hypothetical protein